MANTLITNLSKYMAENYDGQIHEWGEDQEALFNAVFHDDLQFSSFGHSSSQEVSRVTIRNKDDRRKDEQKFVNAGTRYFGKDGKVFTIIDERHLRWQATFKTPKFEAHRDYLVEYSSDGKVLVLEPYNEATAIKPKHRQYMAKMYDGQVKEYSDAEQALVDDMFHDDFQQLNGDGEVVRDKEAMHAFVKGLLKLGTRITELRMTVVDERRLSIKIHLQNPNIDMEDETIVTVKDEQIWRIEKAAPETTN